LQYYHFFLLLFINKSVRVRKSGNQR